MLHQGVEELQAIADECAADRFKAMESKPVFNVLYLDLDGTVRKGFDELGRFVNTAADVEVFPEALREMRRYKKAGYKICGITNQGGIALGHLTLSDAVHALRETHRQSGELFDLILMCRHHPDAKDPLMAHCLCRKPRYGLIVEAQAELSQRFGGICPPSRALFVGDRDEDRQCAAGAGIPFIEAAEWRKGLPITVEV